MMRCVCRGERGGSRGFGIASSCPRQAGLSQAALWGSTAGLVTPPPPGNCIPAFPHHTPTAHLVKAVFRSGETGGEMRMYRMICRIQEMVTPMLRMPTTSFSQYFMIIHTHLYSGSSPCEVRDGTGC